MTNILWCLIQSTIGCDTKCETKMVHSTLGNLNMLLVIFYHQIQELLLVATRESQLKNACHQQNHQA